MLIVNDIILPVRKKLADQDEKKWSNEELIDNINSSLIEICRDTLIFKNTIKIELFHEKPTYPLPNDFLSIIHATIKDENCDVKSYDYIQKNYLNIQDHTIAIDGVRLHLYPTSNKSMRFSYNYYIQIEEIEDNIELPLFTKNAIVFYVMHLAHQTQTSKNSHLKTKDYFSLYKAEINMIKETLLSNKNSKKVRTTYQKV